MARLCASGARDGAPYLIIAWCPGATATEAAAEARAGDDDEALHRLLVAVADAYATLHERGVLHGDVHAGNILVDAQGLPTLLDFAFASAAGEAAPRVAAPFAIEPELAAAHRADAEPPPATFAGEQYAVAALLAEMASGSLYLDFSLEPEETWRQSARTSPASTAPVVTGPGRTSSVRCVARSPSAPSRYPSMRAFADAVRAAAPPVPASTAARSPGGASLAAAPVRAASARLEGFVDAQLARLAPGGGLAGDGAPALASVVLGSAGTLYALLRIARARDDGQVLSLADLWLHGHRRHLAGTGRVPRR